MPDTEETTAKQFSSRVERSRRAMLALVEDGSPEVPGGDDTARVSADALACASVLTTLLSYLVGAAIIRREDPVVITKALEEILGGAQEIVPLASSLVQLNFSYSKTNVKSLLSEIEAGITAAQDRRKSGGIH